MSRWIMTLSAVLLFLGCNAMPKTWELPMNSASADFAEALDQFVASGDPASLRLVAEKDVQGEWGMRAEAIVKLNEKHYRLSQEVDGLTKEVDSLNREIAGLTKEVDSLNEKLGTQQDQLKKKEQQLSRTQESKALLSRDNEILEVTLERLRQALIDLEQRTQ